MLGTLAWASQGALGRVVQGIGNVIDSPDKSDLFGD